MRTWMRFALFTACFFGLSPLGALADDSTSSVEGDSMDEKLISEAIALRKQGRDADALAMFERAYARRPSPRALAQIGLAHQALGDWREAERGLVEALQSSDEWIDRYRSALERSLATVRSHLAWLEVESNVGAAEVWVNSELIGRLPLERPVRVVAGTATVRVVAPGRDAIQRTVEVEQNSQVHAVFTFLEPPAPNPLPAEAKQRFVAAPVKHAASTARTAGWVTLGGAGALALVGIGGMVTREMEARIYNGSQCAPLASIQCADNRNIGTTAETIGIVALVGAGVAAGGAGALLFLASRSADTQSAKHSACGPLGLGLSCSGSF